MDKSIDLNALLDNCGGRLISMSHYLGGEGRPLPPVDSSRLSLLRGFLSDIIGEVAMSLEAWIGMSIPDDESTELAVTFPESISERRASDITSAITAIRELRLAALLSRESFAGTEQLLEEMASDRLAGIVEGMLGV